MRRATLAGSSLLLMSAWIVAGPAAGGEPMLADIVKEVLETLDKITTTLKTVKDEQTAKAAVPDLRKGVARFKELRNKADKAKPPSKEENARLKKEYKDKIENTHKKLFAEIARVKKTPGGREALKEITLIVDKAK